LIEYSPIRSSGSADLVPVWGGCPKQDLPIPKPFDLAEVADDAFG
jgi:hypothetical protein